MGKFKKFGIYRILFLLLFFLYLKDVKAYFESFELNRLSGFNSLIEIRDYFNLSIFMTSSKEIYMGIPPQKISTISSSENFNNLTSGVTYNKNYILMVCTDNYLVSKIDIETGTLTPLINYDNITMPNYTCGSFTDKDYLYISMSYIILKNDTNLTNDDSINETNYFSESVNDFNESVNYFSESVNYFNKSINDFNESVNYFNESVNYLSESINYFTDKIENIPYDDNENQYLEHSILKIKLNFNEDNGLTIDEENEIIKYTLKNTTKYVEMLPKSSILSCEVINVKNIKEESKAICGYIGVNFLRKYYAKAIVISEEMTQEIQIKDLGNGRSSIKLQRLNSESIIAITTSYDTILTIEKQDSEYILKDSKSRHFSNFQSKNDLYFYNNKFLFSSTGTSRYVFIKKENSVNYFKFKDHSNNITKMIGFYNEINDSLLSIYEYNNNKVSYFILENITVLYELKSNPKILEVISNTTTIYDTRNLLNASLEIEPLQIESLINYIDTRERQRTYDKYIIDNETQNLTIYGSNNDWVAFNFFYEGIKEENPKNGISYNFFFENCKLTIKTCLFKCGRCYQAFNICTTDSCKQNFAMKRDDPDFECFANDQNFPNYIYSSKSNYFERCYERCKFCSAIGLNSSISAHHCKVCEDNYLRSYQYPGNCYKIQYPYNTSKYLKAVINKEDENYTLFDSCPDDKNYKINDTGECVSSCPISAPYYTYSLNKSFNISSQEENYIGLLYPLSSVNVPRFYYRKVCYSQCPSYTKKNYQLNICQCLYAWNYTNDSDILCYDNQDYCHTLDYYYHHGSRECKLNNCRDSYFKLNFECFKDKCPEGTKLDPQDSQNCIPFKYYFYINEYFKTIYRNKFMPEYPYKYDATTLYLKSCNESIYYFNITTYLYNNTCYKECPIETYLNISEGICSCIYYIHYLDKIKSSYECTKENEKCSDNNRYNISDRKQCVDTKEECLNLGYKIFNYECINECPINTEDDGNGICLCKFYFLNISNIYTCFNETQTCETLGYPIKKNNTNECFQSQIECTVKGYKYFNNVCYDSCPENMNDKNNNGICLCKYNYINNTNQLICLTQEESCISKGYNYTNLDTNECFVSLELKIEI